MVRISLSSTEQTTSLLCEIECIEQLYTYNYFMNHESHTIPHVDASYISTKETPNTIYIR